MLDSVKKTTWLNLINLPQKALDAVQWYSRWFIVCFSVAHEEQLSLSVMPARKRLDLVGKMWCIFILNWNAINFESLVIRKGNQYTVWMFSLEKPHFKILMPVDLRCYLGPVYTGPDKFLHGQKLARFHLAFTRDRRK